MSEKILGLFSPPLTVACALEDGQRINGSRRAGADFYANIYKYGSFDKYHCFISNKFNANEINNYLHDDDRFRIMPLSKIKGYLQKYNYTAFHQLGPTLKSRLINLRNIRSKNLFPITTTTHSISYVYMPSEVFSPYCHYPLHPFDGILASSKVVKKTLQYFFNQISRQLNALIPSSNFHYPGQIPVIPLGVDIQALLKWKKGKKHSREELDIPEDACVILCFGRLSSGTKADLLPLIQSFRQIIRQDAYKKCILIISGSGNEARGTSLYSHRFNVIKDFVTTHIPPENIRFYLSVSDEKKSMLYSASDIFVSLSDNIQESLGLTVIEAQAMGLPVIVSDWDGYKDIVVNGVTGFRIPSYWCRDNHLDELAINKKVECYHFRQAQSIAIDIQEFLSCLTMLIKSKTLREKLGKQAHIHARQYYWEHIIRRYERLWCELHAESERLTSLCGINNLRISDTKRIGKLTRQCLGFSYYEAFHHFATRIVDENWTLKLGSIKELLTDTISNNLSLKLILRILELIEKAMSKNNEVLICDLICELAETNSLDNQFAGLDYKEEIIRHIMWLFKQGVVNCSPATNDDDLNRDSKGLLAMVT